MYVNLESVGAECVCDRSEDLVFIFYLTLKCVRGATC